MEKERRKAVAFLIIGSSINALAITQRSSSLKISFHSLGTVFLIIAIVKFVQLYKAARNKN